MVRLYNPIVRCSICCPRTRGDGPRSGLFLLVLAKLSPHTRGWSDYQITFGCTQTVVHAHAGMVRGRFFRACAMRCCPRTRGDGPSGATAAPPPPSLSPHTRGWSAAVRLSETTKRVVPAHAGMVRENNTILNPIGSCPAYMRDDFPP